LRIRCDGNILIQEGEIVAGERAAKKLHNEAIKNLCPSKRNGEIIKKKSQN